MLLFIFILKKCFGRCKIKVKRILSILYFRLFVNVFENRKQNKKENGLINKQNKPIASHDHHLLK